MDFLGVELVELKASEVIPCAHILKRDDRKARRMDKAANFVVILEAAEIGRHGKGLAGKVYKAIVADIVAVSQVILQSEGRPTAHEKETGLGGTYGLNAVLSDVKRRCLGNIANSVEAERPAFLDNLTRPQGLHSIAEHNTATKLQKVNTEKQGVVMPAAGRSAILTARQVSKRAYALTQPLEEKLEVSLVQDVIPNVRIIERKRDENALPIATFKLQESAKRPLAGFGLTAT